VCQFFREFLTARDFIEIHSPKLLGGASEGGANVFTLDYFGTPACLAQVCGSYLACILHDSLPHSICDNHQCVHVYCVHTCHVHSASTLQGATTHACTATVVSYDLAAHARTCHIDFYLLLSMLQPAVIYQLHLTTSFHAFSTSLVTSVQLFVSDV
jgi:tRNA synthetases class II (D, K and N)